MIQTKNPTIDTSFRGTSITPGVELTGIFVNCSFYLASLNGVVIKNAKFYSCSFITSTIRHSKIINTLFSNCSFVGASFRQSDVIRTSFRACDFKGASLLELRGTSTCTFTRNCKWLERVDTDLIVKLIPGRQHYLVCQAHLDADHIEREVTMSPMKNTMGFQPDNSNTPRRDWRQGPTTPLLPAANLIDPEALPKVEHYRSPAQQIPQDKKPSDYQSHYAYDEEDYGCHYMMGGYSGGRGQGQHQGTYIVTRNAEYKFGYMSNSVLECSDIEEYTECQG